MEQPWQIVGRWNRAWVSWLGVVDSTHLISLSADWDEKQGKATGPRRHRSVDLQSPALQIRQVDYSFVAMAKKQSSKKQTAQSGSGKKAKGKSQPPEGGRTISENRKARHRFEILEKLECGIMLMGSEVKSLRDGKISLDEAYVRVQDGELWLIGADIPEFRQANIWNHAPKRPRKLLVQAGQLQKLTSRAHEKGLTLVPLRVYFNARGLVKVLVGVARGKKLHDKRQAMKNAEVRRQIDRAMRGQRRPGRS